MYTSHSIPMNFYPTSLGDVRICGFVWAMDPLGRTTAMMRWKIHRFFFPLKNHHFPKNILIPQSYPHPSPHIFDSIWWFLSIFHGQNRSFYTQKIVGWIKLNPKIRQVSCLPTAQSMVMAQPIRPIERMARGVWTMAGGILIKHGASNGKIIGRCRE